MADRTHIIKAGPIGGLPLHLVYEVWKRVWMKFAAAKRARMALLRNLNLQLILDHWFYEMLLLSDADRIHDRPRLPLPNLVDQM